MATTMAGKKENPVETAEETGTATVEMVTVEMATVELATMEMATMEMAAEIPITREEAGTRTDRICERREPPIRPGADGSEH